jgi:hypothetical protein
MTGSEIQSRDGEAGAQTVAVLFYSGAIDRIMQAIGVLGLLALPLVWIRYGVLSGGGFLLGAVISYLNFYLLTRSVKGLAERMVLPDSREDGIGIVIKFLCRYLLIGLAAYVTFVSSSAAFRGLLIGLCLPVAGMMGEAAYETYTALRRGL